MSLDSNRAALRNWGWVVAVHNDYKLDGEHRTFWLFTSGTRCAKGEGRTDEEAIAQVYVEACAQNVESMANSDRLNEAARVELIRKRRLEEVLKERDEALAELKVSRATEAAVQAAAARAFANDLQRLRAVVKKLRDAMPSAELPARGPPHPLWKLGKLQAFYPDPTDKPGPNTDYVTQTIEGDVIIEAIAEADKVLS